MNKMNERDELIQMIWDDAVADRVRGGKSPQTVPVVRPKVEAMADRILAAGYRKAEPVWEPSLLNDGVYEYTQTGSCDGSIVYNYRRLPRLQYEGEFPSWESYEPEATK